MTKQEISKLIEEHFGKLTRSCNFVGGWMAENKFRLIYHELFQSLEKEFEKHYY